MTVYPPVSVFLGDCGKCQLELDGGELAEGSQASPFIAPYGGQAFDGELILIEARRLEESQNVLLTYAVNGG